MLQMTHFEKLLFCSGGNLQPLMPGGNKKVTHT